MAPRDRAVRWSECARAAEHRSTRIRAIRTRGAPKARGQADRMGVRDPVTLLQRPPNEAPPQTVEHSAQPGDTGMLGHVRAKRGSLCDPSGERAWGQSPERPG